MQRGQYQGAAARRYDQRWRAFTARTQAPIIAAVTPRLRSGLRVFDAGCGTGTLLAALLTQQPALIAAGADGSLAMIAQARGRLGDHARLIELDLDDPFPADLAAQQFDLITCANVLHYLRKPGVTLQRLADLLTPGGLLIAEDFTRHGWWWPVFERLLRLADAQHQRTLAPAELAQLVAGAGLQHGDIVEVDAGGPWRATTVISSHK